MGWAVRMAASRVVGGGARRRAAAWRPVRACSGDAKRLRKEQLQCRSDIHTRSSGLQSGAARGERWSLPGAEATGASQQAARLLSTSATDMAEASARNLRGQLVGVSAVRDEKVSVGEAQR